MHLISRSFPAALALVCCAAFGQDKGRQYTNPVGGSAIHIADPFILQHDDKYYLFGATPEQDGFLIYESSDLVKWKRKGWALRQGKNSWAEGGFRAPEVKLYHDKYYMTYSAKVRGSKPERSLLALAVSDWPEGPYYDLHAPWLDPGFPVSDGHIFTEDDGTPYLFFSRCGDRDNAIYGAQLAGDLSKLAGQTVRMLEAGQPWETVAATRLNEDPTVLKHEGRYYMTYSANDSGSASYGAGYAVAPGPLGPWTKAAENPILASRPELKVSGPGHVSFVRSPDRGELLIVYQSHADSEKPGLDRVVNIDRVAFDAAGKLVVKGPTRSQQPAPSDR